MIVSTHGIVASYKGIDTDAQAFITATGITNSTQQTAINTIVSDLKNYGIWSRFKAIYPMVGGSATTHKFNLKDPRDLNAAFRLQFVNGWTHSSTGAKPNGTDGYANTFLNSQDQLNLNDAHISSYLRTNVDGNHCDIGAGTSSSDDCSLFPKWGNIFYPRINAVNNGIANTNNSLGFFLSNRVSSTEVRAFQNNTVKVVTNNSVSETSTYYYLGAMNIPTYMTYFYSPREIAFATIGFGLTDTDANNLYSAIQNFNTTLSRNV